MNRDFGQVKADGRVYCYDAFLAGKSAGGIPLANPRGIILLAMPASSTLRIEKRGREGSRCDGAEYTFSGDATDFER